MALANVCKTMSEVETRQQSLAHCNRYFESLDATQRVRWSLTNLPDQHVLSSSFGAQSAVTLHLLTREYADIPVIFIDTGYLFAETYQFVDELTERLDLNLKIFRAPVSPAWQEARHGKRWEQGVAGLDRYNEQVKVEPMKQALRDLEVGTWFAGLRRAQSQSRAGAPFLDWSGDRWKVHPIADWTDRDVYRYLKQHKLPYHPLWKKAMSALEITTRRGPFTKSMTRSKRAFSV